jgi:S-adenosyl-L-methionine hydrolase (adenosine-forming)
VARLLTLLTDFGTADYYVAAVKGTVLRLAPGAQIVDLSHAAAPGDVEGGSDLLAAAAPTFPAGTVHLAVIDPGVGSARRILAVEAGGQRFLAPDNGLLTPFLGASFPVSTGAPLPFRAWSVERSDLFLPSPGATFHGRDRFAPAAAALLRGEAPESLGPEVAEPVRLALEPPSREATPAGEHLRGRVVRVDRFGNLVTDLPAAWLGRGELPAVEVAGRGIARWVGHYAELPAGEPGALIGSLGTVELSLPGASLAERWGIGRGAPVRIVLYNRVLTGSGGARSGPSRRGGRSAR